MCRAAVVAPDKWNAAIANETKAIDGSTVEPFDRNGSSDSTFARVSWRGATTFPPLELRDRAIPLSRNSNRALTAVRIRKHTGARAHDLPANAP